MGLTRAKATNIRWFVLGTALMCLGAAGQAASAQPGGCSPLPGSHVRVRLTLAAAGIPIDERVVKSVVERAWSTAGVEVEWISEATPFSWKGVDLLVRVQRARPSLGAIQYENGVGHKVLQLSTDATIERLKGPVSRQYQIQEASALHLLAAGGLRDVEESLGSAIAREISPCTAAQ